MVHFVDEFIQNDSATTIPKHSLKSNIDVLHGVVISILLNSATQIKDKSSIKIGTICPE